MEAGDELKGRVRVLADLIEYQRGAVVSKTLIKQQAGSVTVFAFDEGQELSEHTVPHDALVHVLDGEVEITIAGEVSRVCSGEAIVMPGGRPHAVRAVRSFKMMLAMIRA